MVILLAINVIVLGPITEELVFRGILMHLFFKQNQLFFKVLLSALIFASAHGGDTIFGFLIYVVNGAVFAVVYLKTGKIQGWSLKSIHTNICKAIHMSRNLKILDFERSLRFISFMA